jgi:hypothetical protein
MPFKEFNYHGQAVGFYADIWEPGPHKVEHARSAVTGKKPGHNTAKQDPFEIPTVVSHGGCTTEVIAHAEDNDGFFRTEVHATLNNLNMEGGVLTADQIKMGMVSVYRRKWWDNGKPHAQRVRVVPYGCSIVNLKVKGEAVKDHLPAPFHYSTDRCETYLRGDDPDPKVEAELRKAITDSPTRLLYVKNFGRIFFGEWTLLPSDDWHPIHQIYMVRMALGSPQTGSGGGSGGQGDGSGGGNGGTGG